MEPEPQFAKSLETEETERLQQKISSLKDAEKKVIVEDGLALAQKQDEKEGKPLIHCGWLYSPFT